MGQTSKVWQKLVILAFRLTFAPCVEALLKFKFTVRYKKDVICNFFVLHVVDKK